MFVLGAISQYLGAALAFSLFTELGVSMVAFLRVTGAAIIIITLKRSWKRSFVEIDIYWTAAFGIVLAAMNLCFYLAIVLLLFLRLKVCVSSAAAARRHAAPPIPPALPARGHHLLYAVRVACLC